MTRLLLCIVFAHASSASAQFSMQYDRFRDKTELWGPNMEVTIKEAGKGRLAVQAGTFFSGSKPTTAPPYVRVSFRSMSKEWRYLKCHNLAALVAGKPLELPEARHEGETWGSGVLESVYVTVPWKDFVTIANGPVEFRICNTELRIPEGRLADWRALVKAGTP